MRYIKFYENFIINENVEMISFLKLIYPHIRVLDAGFGDKAYNYETKNGVEVTFVEDTGALINDENVQADIMLDCISSSNRNMGNASKELNRILELIDKLNMSISLVVDSKSATTNILGSKEIEIGLSDVELKKWYSSKGFIFEDNDNYGYRPSKSENFIKKETYEINLNIEDIDINKIDGLSDPETLRNMLSRKMLEENIIYEDGDGRLYIYKHEILYKIKNIIAEYKYTKDNNGFINGNYVLSLVK